MAQHRIDHYEILSKAGAGTQATVYRARDVNSGRIVALKVLDSKWADDPQYRERFVREARLAASVNHPNVVTVHEVGEDSGQLYMAMEYLSSSLQAFLEEHGSIPVGEALRIVRDVANALDGAHKRGIVHRDIKPANVLLTEDLLVKVSDFGIARAAGLPTMTNIGSIMGTPHYMSPEQARGERADIQSDIYALGIVLYQLLAGQLPFDADTPLAVLRQHIDDAPPSVRQHRRELPPELDAIVGRCLAKDKGHRYQTPAELAGALNKAWRELELPSSPPGTVESYEAATLPPPTIFPSESSMTRSSEQETRDERQRTTSSQEDIGSAEQQLESAHNLLTQGLYHGAVTAANNAIDLDPTLSQAYYMKTLALVRLKLREEALAAVDKLIELRPEHAAGHSTKAQILYFLGREQEALAVADRAIELRPDSFGDHRIKAQALIRLKRHDEALDAIHKAVELRPEAATTHLVKAKILSALDRQKEALSVADDAVALGPSDPGVHSVRAEILHHLRRDKEAQTAVDEAIRLRPSDGDVHCLKAEILHHLRRNKEALAAAEMAIGLDPENFRAHRIRGETLIALGQDSEAIASLDRAIELAPEDSQAQEIKRSVL